MKWFVLIATGYLLMLLPGTCTADSLSTKIKKPGRANISFVDIEGMKYKARVKHIDSNYLLVDMRPYYQQSVLEANTCLESNGIFYQIHYSNLKMVNIRKGRIIAMSTLIGAFAGGILSLPIANTLLKGTDHEAQIGGYLVVGGLGLGTLVGIIRGLTIRRKFEINGHQNKMSDFWLLYF